MKKLFLTIVGIAVISAGVYIYVAGQGKVASILPDQINADIDTALLSVTIDLTEYGAESLTLENGQATFTASEDIGGGTGFVSLEKPRAIVVKGDDADVLALINVSGGGTGTFQYLVRFEYIGATKQVTEIEKVILGDRITVNSITTEIVEPTHYEVLVATKDRKPFEGMAAEPKESRLLHFRVGDDGLGMVAVTFGTVEKYDVVLVSPLPEQQVETSFVVQGAARGTWYFEASFPIEVRNYDGEVVATGIAQAQDDWMTEDLVPFSADIVVPSTAQGLHSLVIKKDNPSDLPENDAEVAVPIVIQ
jgi:hypothetical protein